MIWLGDFNRHHESWELHTNSHLYSPADKIDPLLDVLYENGMSMALLPYEPTLQASSGNWTCPDNVWWTTNSSNLIMSCEVHPNLRPAGADHMPILTELDLSVPQSLAEPTHNFCLMDFDKFCTVLKTNLNLNCTACRISTEAEFNKAADLLVITIQETIETLIPLTKPSPFSKQWWTRKLTDLQRNKNGLSRKSHHLRDIKDHPIHKEYHRAANNYKERIDETRDEHWADWLKEISAQDIYIANKYLSGEPNDYSRHVSPPYAPTVD